MVLVTGHLFHQERLTSIAVGATGLAETLVHKNLRSPETNQGAPSMCKRAFIQRVTHCKSHLVRMSLAGQSAHR